MGEPRFKGASKASESEQLGPRRRPRFKGATEARLEREGGAIDLARGAASGFNRGLLELAGSPVDLVNLGLRQIPGVGPFISSDRPVGGSRQLAETTAGAAPGLFPSAPDTVAGRITQRVGQEFGRAAIPAAGMTAQAARVPLAVGGAAPSLAQTFFNPIARSPGRAALGEVAATAGAGVGAGIAREAAPGNNTAELIGEIAGGLSPALLAGTPTALITRGASGLARRVSPAAQRTRARLQAGEVIGGEMTEQAATGLSEAEQLRRDIPGFNPTLGEATNSPAFLATQTALEARASGPQLEQFAARRAGSEQAVEQFAERQAPEGPDVEAEDLVTAAANRINQRRGAVEAQAQEVAGERAGIAEGIQAINRADLGQEIRHTLKERKDAVSGDMTALANSLGISDADVSVNYGRLRDRILAEFKPSSVFDDRTAVPQLVEEIRNISPRLPLRSQDIPAGAVIGQPVPGPSVGQATVERPVTFKDLKALRERVSDDLINATSGRDVNRKEVRGLVRLKSLIDEGVNDLTASADPDLAARYQQFREQYFRDYVTPFETGASLAVRSRDSSGFQRTPNEKVAAAFFGPGEVSAARQYRQIFANDSAAIGNIEAAALDSLREAAVRDGVLSPRQAQTWLRRHQSVLDEFPEIAEGINTVFDADKALRGRAEELVTRTKQIDDAMLAREIKAFSRGTRAPEAIVKNALADARKMEQLTDALGKERLPELRRLVWKQANAQSGTDMARFMETNRDSLAQIFDNRHLRNLQRIIGAKTMTERTPAPTGSAAVNVPLAGVERQIGQGIPQLGSRIFAFRSGRMQRGYLVVDTLLRGARGRAAAGADELLSEALYDPQVASDLISAIDVGHMRAPVAKRLQARLFALPPTLTEDERSAP